MSSLTLLNCVSHDDDQTGVYRPQVMTFGGNHQHVTLLEIGV